MFTKKITKVKEKKCNYLRGRGWKRVVGEEVGEEEKSETRLRQWHLMSGGSNRRVR